MIQNGDSNPVARIASLLTMLWPLAASDASPSSMPLTQGPTSEWDVSDASVTAGRKDTFDSEAIKRALVELRTTRSILLIGGDLRNEAAFGAFLDEVDVAISTFEVGVASNSLTVVTNAQALATRLALARNNLQATLATFSAWVALARAIQTDGPRYIAIPERFVAKRSGSIKGEAPPSAADVAAMFELG